MAIINSLLHWWWFGHLEKNDRGCREIRSKEKREAAWGSDFCHLCPNTGDTCLKPRLRAVLDGPGSASGEWAPLDYMHFAPESPGPAI